MAQFRSWCTRGFNIILIVGFIVGALLFFRPVTSAVENRELTHFPAFTWEIFLNGSFFSDVSLWYADTYPLREPLVAVSQGLQSLYGIDTGTRMVGGNVKADELPPIDGAAAASTDESADEEPKEREAVPLPDEKAMAENIQNQIMSGLYVDNGAAYSIYYFSQESVQGYADAINACAKALEGTAEVFSVLVPNNSAVLLDDETLDNLGGTNQGDAIKYFDSLFLPEVHTVDILDTLREHNSEYLYFRSDHHWTQLGAYYAYLEFCKEADVKPVTLDERESVIFQPFLGSYYTQLADPTMAANPDFVQAWIPNGTNDMTYWDADGAEIEANVVTDVTGWAENSFYNTFIAGDQPLEHIVNDEIDDDSSVLVIKDSFGCAFVPLLVDSFHEVYVIDFRYWYGNIPDFVREKGIKDVVFLNNISLAGTIDVANKLMSMM